MPNTPLSPEERAALDQLIDIQLPEAIGIWPLATPLFSALILLAITIITIAVYLLNQRYHRRFKHAALQELKKLQQQSERLDDGEYIRQINTLLNRLFFSYAPATRATLGPRWGKQWFTELATHLLPLESAKKYADAFDVWHNAQYSRNLDKDPIDREHLFHFAKDCIVFFQPAQDFSGARE